MDRHPARARLPKVALGLAQSGQFAPCAAAVGGFENRSVLDSGVRCVRIRKRRFEMPHALEFPRMLRAIVKLVRGQRFSGFGGRVIDELIAGGLRGTRRRRLSGRGSGLMPGFAAVVGALNELAEPSAGLRGVDAIWFYGRAFQVITIGRI